MQIRVIQASGFIRAFKRLHNNHKDAVDAGGGCYRFSARIGQAQKGDLVGIFVYKFDCVNRAYLLAYEFDPPTRFLLLVGVHENFFTAI